MKGDVANRQSNLVGHLRHPTFNHREKQGTGSARRIEELDDMYLCTRVAERRRMFARESRLTRCILNLDGLSVNTLVPDQCCHKTKHQQPDTSRDENPSTITVSALVAHCDPYIEMPILSEQARHA
jgi:hypothetical protein